MTWRDAASLAEFGDRDVIGREIAGRPLALYRLEEAYFATAGLCTHGGACLSEGEVVEGFIECPLHFGLFDVRTGRAAGAPVTRDLAVYPVRVEGDRLLVEIAEEG